MQSLIVLERLINRIADALGWIASSLFLLLMLNVFYNVVMRYAFDSVSIALQEMEWHLFSAVFLLGVPYAVKAGGHVRIDVLYERWSEKTQALVDLLGCVLFLMPFAVLIVYFGIDFANESLQLGESSGDPGGLPHRWIIKAMIPLSFFFIAVTGLGLILNALSRLLRPAVSGSLQ
ncbi:C4-dicarboxylate ABC transporter [Enterovibrio norvegicus]|uniref:TRAP transporter small permease protein n=1 Tax=Enterovibrio gelatinilyticus TaxID=2899819 RepID=A0ABT5R4I5_9GAMM|nr:MULTISPECIES: TRAP transporter small permease subunit [Enterovibrio]MDD1795182.1 TRAP transporter small permease subunit [Enterovibrio sp. ZSDZ42]OEE75162.1 C4-dicarboxylate ABC transporter [Enterovibrio norvegicus FF-162]OEF49770.1 C4-dicarboxylate ABC transporter [Enterovibrio norvegicus]